MFSQELKTLPFARLNISACHLPRGSGALVHRGACVHWASRCQGAGGDDPLNLHVLAVICCPILHEANMMIWNTLYKTTFLTVLILCFKNYQSRNHLIS